MKKKSAYIIISAAIVVTAVFTFINGHFIGNQSQVTNYSTEQKFEFEEGQVQDIQEASTSKGIKIPGYSTIPVNAQSSEISVDLVNPDENEVYFQISFYLTDTQELIYQSKLLAPGQHLYSINLDRALDNGEYPLTIQYDTFSMDGAFTPKNGASVNCFLSVS